MTRTLNTPILSRRAALVGAGAALAAAALPAATTGPAAASPTDIADAVQRLDGLGLRVWVGLHNRKWTIGFNVTGGEWFMSDHAPVKAVQDLFDDPRTQPAFLSYMERTGRVQKLGRS